MKTRLLRRMSTREKIGTAFILTFFFSLLGFMLWLEQATVWDVITIIAIGFLFVGGSIYLMLKVWEDEDDE